jgi:hypothetical protein
VEAHRVEISRLPLVAKNPLTDGGDVASLKGRKFYLIILSK